MEVQISAGFYIYICCTFPAWELMSSSMINTGSRPSVLLKKIFVCGFIPDQDVMDSGFSRMTVIISVKPFTLDYLHIISVQLVWFITSDAPNVSGYSLLIGLTRLKNYFSFFFKEHSFSSYVLCHMRWNHLFYSSAQVDLGMPSTYSPCEDSTCIFGALKQGTYPSVVSSLLRTGSSRRESGLANTVVFESYLFQNKL